MLAAHVHVCLNVQISVPMEKTIEKIVIREVLNCIHFRAFVFEMISAKLVVCRSIGPCISGDVLVPHNSDPLYHALF